ncbi:hypothetical protein P1J78_03855 [Psychromarinibacter sp. C21-152]|uniref:Uncharacterized protein n=1 Tax=Psychromarinibacter sediminicola TaxID=3033385 RepID=A0AAE3NPS1_9RHOB|nr:hypothetical protein [Psychromarinibacter sediminicola]MDF0599861.1 hypothetical protein [Psychromarinibacter sediminicola]
MTVLPVMAGLVAAAGAAWAQCDLPAPSWEAGNWEVFQTPDYDYYASSPEYPGLRVRLDLDAPVTPRVLDFATPPRYGGRVGVLQYFSGDPGTSYLVTIVRNAVVDLRTGETLGMPVYSEDCEPADWQWYDDRVVVEMSYGTDVIELS